MEELHYCCKVVPSVFIGLKQIIFGFVTIPENVIPVYTKIHKLTCDWGQNVVILEMTSDMLLLYIMHELFGCN